MSKSKAKAIKELIFEISEKWTVPLLQNFEMEFQKKIYDSNHIIFFLFRVNSEISAPPDFSEILEITFCSDHAR